MYDNIIDALGGIRTTKFQVLAETLETANTMYRYIRNDWDTYCASNNKPFYQLSSYALQKLTISDTKLRKKFNLCLTKDDPEKIIGRIRTTLKAYILKNIKECMLEIHPEFGGTTCRLHFHGIYYGSALYINKIVSWWRRNIGFVSYRVLSGLNWFDYINKQALPPLYFFKGGFGVPSIAAKEFEKQCEKNSLVVGAPSLPFDPVQ